MSPGKFIVMDKKNLLDGNRTFGRLDIWRLCVSINFLKQNYFLQQRKTSATMPYLWLAAFTHCISKITGYHLVNFLILKNMQANHNFSYFSFHKSSNNTIANATGFSHFAK